MSKLKEEELLELLDAIFIGYILFLTKGRQWKKKEEIMKSEFLKHKTQVFQQIKKRIQKHISREDLFEIKAQEYERGLKDAQPAVDEGFINSWANEFATAAIADKQMHRRIAYMLKEAGVEVVGK